MSRNNNQVVRNRSRSIMLSCLMLFGALSAGIPNATAITGNETILGSSLTNSSADLSIGNLDTNDSYYWWVWVLNSSGNLTDFDYGLISPNSSSMTVQSTWVTPSVIGNYTVNTELYDSTMTTSLVNSTIGTFYFSGSGGTSSYGSKNDAGSGGADGANATA